MSMKTRTKASFGVGHGWRSDRELTNRKRRKNEATVVTLTEEQEQALIERAERKFKSYRKF